MNEQAQEALRTIREAAMLLPMGKRNQVINRCDRIQLLLRKAKAHTPTGMEQHDEIADRYNTTRRIVAALLAGESVCYLDAARFGTAEFHTRICEARQLIKDRYPEYELRSEWRRGTNCNYKVYFLEDKI